MDMMGEESTCEPSLRIDSVLVRKTVPAFFCPEVGHTYGLRRGEGGVEGVSAMVKVQ